MHVKVYELHGYLVKTEYYVLFFLLVLHDFFVKKPKMHQCACKNKILVYGG